MSERELPSHYEAERSLLGAMLLNPNAIDVAMMIIGDSSEPFFNHQNRLIYTAMVNLYRDGDPVDIITISASLLPKYTGQVNAVYIAELTDAVPTSANADHYAEIIVDNWTRRRLIKAAQRAVGDLYDTNVPLVDIREGLESEVFKTASSAGKSKPEHLGALATQEKARIKSMVRGEMTTGVKTGFRDLDSILLPMRPADYIILAATTSTGKTTLACNIALNAAREGVGVLIFSLEMSKQAITNKLLSIESGVDLVSVERNSWIPDGAEEKINNAADYFKKLGVHIDDECGMTPARLRTKARGHMTQNKIGLILIDYIGRMTVKGLESDPTTTISVISNEIKDMAKELAVPVLAMSQLSRKGAEGKPQLSHLRQSGSLEQDCDVAILLSRCKNPEYVCAEIAKQRTGPCGEAILFFKKDTQRFLSLDTDGNPIFPGSEHWHETEKRPARYEEDEAPF